MQSTSKTNNKTQPTNIYPSQSSATHRDWYDKHTLMNNKMDIVKKLCCSCLYSRSQWLSLKKK